MRTLWPILIIISLIQVKSLYWRPKYESDIFEMQGSEKNLQLLCSTIFGFLLLWSPIWISVQKNWPILVNIWLTGSGGVRCDLVIWSIYCMHFLHLFLTKPRSDKVLFIQKYLIKAWIRWVWECMLRQVVHMWSFMVDPYNEPNASEVSHTVYMKFIKSCLRFIVPTECKLSLNIWLRPIEAQGGGGRSCVLIAFKVKLKLNVHSVTVLSFNFYVNLLMPAVMWQRFQLCLGQRLWM